MRYILLLRGINVGGKNKVAMSDLKVLLTELGFEDVDSYINSGNLFFNSVETYESCISKIKHLLEMNFDFLIPFTLIRVLEREGEPSQMVASRNGKKRCFILFL